MFSAVSSEVPEYYYWDKNDDGQEAAVAAFLAILSNCVQ
jgi:hypothetical protein